jgi:hypothetical protein
MNEPKKFETSYVGHDKRLSSFTYRARQKTRNPKPEPEISEPEITET